jgi:acyl-CoA synthetase (AMP-forming)/AMP-acid ligase II
VLSRHDDVREVVVMARDDGQGMRFAPPPSSVTLLTHRTGTEKWLAAYVVPTPGHNPTADELRSYARGKLPPYMVPVAVVVMAGFPLTPNSKVDLRALPGTHSPRCDRVVV